MVAKRLVEVIAPKFSDKKGGYTRILHYQFRKGDGAQLALLELTVPIDTTEKKPTKEKKKKAAKPLEVEEPREVYEKKAPQEYLFSILKFTAQFLSDVVRKGLFEAAKRLRDNFKTLNRHPQEEVKKQEPLQEKKKAEGEAEPAKETPKKGGFLSNLRKFLTGKDE